MTFRDALHYSDALLALVFEGIKTKVNYTSDELNKLFLTQKYGIINPYVPSIRKLYFTKLFRRPI